MDMVYAVNNTCLYGSLRKRGFFPLKLLSGVNSLVKLWQSEGTVQFWFLYFRYSRNENSRRTIKSGFYKKKYNFAFGVGTAGVLGKETATV